MSFFVSFNSAWNNFFISYRYNHNSTLFVVIWIENLPGVYSKVVVAQADLSPTCLVANQHPFTPSSLGFSSLSICFSLSPSSQGDLSPLCRTPGLGCQVCGLTYSLLRVRVYLHSLPFPLSPSLGAQVPTWSFYSSLIMWKYLLKSCLYRSSASFQSLFCEKLLSLILTPLLWKQYSSLVGSPLPHHSVFSNLNISFHCLLAYKYFVDKLTDNLIGCDELLLFVAFKILSLSFDSLIIICLSIGLWLFILLEFVEYLAFVDLYISLHWEFFSHYFLK